jgi:hypothetical protein
VDACGELRRECRINHAMPLDPALLPERIRHDMNPEMGLSTRPVAGVSFMQMRLVNDAQAFGRESLGQLLCDQILRSHRVASVAGAAVSADKATATRFGAICQVLNCARRPLHNVRS